MIDVALGLRLWMVASILFMGLSAQLSHAAALNVDDIQDKGVLVVGVDIPYGVMEFYDKDGREAGIDIDISREIARQLGVKVQFVAMPFEQLFLAIHERSVDLVASAVTITPKRQETLLFSEPYLDAGMSLAVAASNTDILRLEDLSGKRVGVLKGTIGEEMAAKSPLFANAEIIHYQANDIRMAELIEGKVDAAIVHFLTTDDSSIRLVGEPLTMSFYGLVTHLSNRTLIVQINRILRDMKRNNTLRNIKLKYVE